MIDSLDELPSDDFTKAIEWIIESDDELSAEFIKAFDDKYSCQTWPVLKVHGGIYSLVGLKLLPKLMGKLIESIEFYHAKIEPEGLAHIASFCQMISATSISCKKILFYNCQMPVGLNKGAISLPNLKVHLGEEQQPPNLDDMKELDLSSYIDPTELKKAIDDESEQELTPRTRERSQTIFELLTETNGNSSEGFSYSSDSSLLIANPFNRLSLSQPDAVTLSVELVGEG